MARQLINTARPRTRAGACTTRIESWFAHMPIRFQVDGDFYDHPKAVDASDAAVALWTRAGSYSTAKLLDGFVPEGMLARLSKSDAPFDVAAELVRCGLWRRVRGGFRFHQWDQRNLTRARVEADRDYDRDKKRRQRQQSRKAPRKPGENGNEESEPQVNGQVVPPGHTPGHGRDSPGDTSGTPPGIPPVSVSVSVSESVSGSGRGARRGPPDFGDEPPHRCPEHLDDPNPPPCGRCAEARRGHERWERDRDLAKAEWERTAPRCRLHPTEFAHNCRNCRSERLAAA